MGRKVFIFLAASPLVLGRFAREFRGYAAPAPGSTKPPCYAGYYTPYDNFDAPMSTHFDPLVGWNAVSGSYWLTRDDILVVEADAIVA